MEFQFSLHHTENWLSTHRISYQGLNSSHPPELYVYQKYEQYVNY